MVGEGLGVIVLKGMLSTAGSIILLSIVYWLSFFTLLGVHPLKFIKALTLWSVEKVQQAREGWASKAAQKERAAAGKKSSSSKNKSGSRGRQNTNEDDALEQEIVDEPLSYEQDEKGQSHLPLQEIPEPQIIDATQRTKENHSVRQLRSK